MEKPESQANELDPAFLKARDAAFRLLSYRARSEAEVRRRLLQRYAPEVTEQVIKCFRRHRLLDDQDFARQWRQARQRRPRARRVVQQELLRLGISSDVIQEALEGFDDESSAYQAGYKLARRLLSQGLPREEFRQRLGSHLQRRGFGYGLAREASQRLWNELGAELLDCQEDAEDDEQQPPKAEPEGRG